MMKKKKNNWPFNFIILLLGFTPFTALSQKSDYRKKLEDNAIINPKYISYIDSARTYIKKNDSLSLSYYLRAFSEELPENPTHIYESASLSAKLGHNDLAFFLLNLSVNKIFSYYDHFLKDQNIQNLDSEKLDRYHNKIRETDSIYTQISVQLEAIYDNDQDIREYYYNELNKGKEKDSPEMKAILDSMTIVDRRNFTVINELIEKYGFLGTNMKTMKSRNAMFAVIQHASTEEKESLLPVLHHAIRKGELHPGQFAYMEDRMLAERENIQKYGSQYMIRDGEVIISPPLIDPEMVDIYRKSVGLSSLQEYIDLVKSMENP